MAKTISVGSQINVGPGKFFSQFFTIFTKLFVKPSFVFFSDLREVIRAGYLLSNMFALARGFGFLKKIVEIF